MSAPLITVLIATYNYGRFVEEAIESVLAQEFPLEQVEIVVVDDGSTDDTAERVAKYGSKVRYLRKTNGGQASALNLGFAEARGEIVALLDADDLFLPGKLARVADAFQQDPALGMVYHRLLEWDTQTNERRALTPPLISGDLRKAPEHFLSYPVQPASCIAFRRTTLGPFLPIPETIRMLADAYPVILLPLISPILALSEPLTLYRIHGSNSYYADKQQMPSQVRSARLQFEQILKDSILKWLAADGDTLKQPHVRFFSNRWTLAYQELQFLTHPPGRLRFFWFLLRQNHTYSSIQSWKLTAFNYLAAFSALVFGYKRADRFYKWRGAIMNWLQQVARSNVRRSRTGES